MQHVHSILKSAYTRRKKSRPAFNLTHLSKKLGVSVGFLSQVFCGKRAVPLRLATELCALLDLDQESRDRVLASAIRGRRDLKKPGLLESVKPLPDKRAPIAWTLPSVNDFWLLEDPIYLILLNCTSLKQYDGSEDFFAQFVSESPENIRAALDRLVRAKFLKRGGGKLSRTEKFFSFNSSQGKDAIRKYHRNGLRFANASLLKRTSEAEAELRFINTAVITLSKAKVIWAKQRLRECLEGVMAELSSDDPDDLYQIGIQFLPLSRPNSERTRNGDV